MGWWRAMVCAIRGDGDPAAHELAHQTVREQMRQERTDRHR
jgi:hypothetical protein